MTQSSLMFDAFDGQSTPPVEIAPRIPIILGIPNSLDELDLDKELAEQFIRAKQLILNAETDDNVTLAQKAQATNSITSILQNIVKMRTDLYNSERIKLIESILISVLKEFPDVQAAFLDRYEAALEAKRA